MLGQKHLTRECCRTRYIAQLNTPIGHSMEVSGYSDLVIQSVAIEVAVEGREIRVSMRNIEVSESRHGVMSLSKRNGV